MTLRTRFSRRQLLAAGAVTAASASVAACGAGTVATVDTASRSESTEPVPETPAVQDLSDQEKVINFSNWPQYIDVSKKNPTTLDDFIAQTGIAVNYTDDINDSNEFFAKVRTNLEQGRSIDRDIVVLTEEGVELFIELGYAAPLNKALIPNASNLLPSLQDVPFDPGRKYSLPWQSGFTGIGWNTRLLERELGVSEITSLDQFFDPALKGRVTILSEMTDTMGIMMNWLGYDMSDFTSQQFSQTLEVLVQKIDEGFIRQVTGNDYISALDSGDAIAVIGWSGDILALGKKFGFAIPDSGGMLWADNMLIPSVATHKSNAEKLMNYYYDPLVAARLAEWVQYVCPVEGAREAMEQVDPDLVDDQWIFPTPELLATVHEFMSLGVDQRLAYDLEFGKAVNM
ncbi:MAG: spermidine/putrescine ABC transporter substrate-binding protein [Candidatus Nanopelagicales bacterium]|nr:spermidine/putrescine ABC transporter substrate-binding protein [Candidatus Nanopelagicales bacterium]